MIRLTVPVHNSISRCGLIAIALFLFVQVTVAASSHVLPKKTSTHISVTVSVAPGAVFANTASIGRLRQLATGGVTPTYRPGRKILQRMRADGIRRLRLINVEWGTVVSVRPNGRLSIHWSRKLENELRLCKKYGYIPHIVIAQTAPRGIAKMTKEGQVYGVTSWETYETYIKAFVRHVAVTWGFNVSEWEVGNEMNNSHWDWLRYPRGNVQLDDRGYRDYIKIYSHISSAFRYEKKALPDKTILLGGPALGGNSLNYPPNDPRNWLVRFVRDVAARHLLCNFVSFHIYGSDFSGADLAKRIGWIKDAMRTSKLNIPIWITEWGASPFFKIARVNFQPVAGAFALAFIRDLGKIGVQNALFLAARRSHRGYGPALFDGDGRPGYTYEALTYVLALSGRRVACRAPIGIVGCIAARDAHGITVLIWYLNWGRQPINSRGVSAGWPLIHVEIKAENGTNYSLGRVAINGVRLRESSYMLGHAARAGHIVAKIGLRYGDFAAIRLKDLATGSATIK